MESLRQKLNNLIRQRQSITWLEIKVLCESGKLGRLYRISNAERRLRASESPDVTTEMHNGHIIRYLWKGAPIVYKTYKILNSDGSVEKVLNYQTN